MSNLTTANTLRERTDVNRYYFWLLLGANRWAVAGGLAVLIFLAFMLWGVLKPVSLHTTMQSSDMVETAFAGLVGAIITGTTLVVTINQLVLSQEIGSLGSQRSRVDTTRDFRQNTDDLLGTVRYRIIQTRLYRPTYSSVWASAHRRSDPSPCELRQP